MWRYYIIEFVNSMSYRDRGRSRSPHRNTENDRNSRSRGPSRSRDRENQSTVAHHVHSNAENDRNSHSRGHSRGPYTSHRVHDHDVCTANFQKLAEKMTTRMIQGKEVEEEGEEGEEEGKVVDEYTIHQTKIKQLMKCFRARLEATKRISIDNHDEAHASATVAVLRLLDIFRTINANSDYNLQTITVKYINKNDKHGFIVHTGTNRGTFHTFSPSKTGTGSTVVSTSPRAGGKSKRKSKRKARKTKRKN